MSDPVVELSHVTKRFGDFTAVDDLSFALARGSILGFLGPNGAGKTTTLRMMLGIFPPDTGDIRVLGRDIGQVRARIGYLPEERGLYRRMRADAAIAYIATLKGLPRADALARARKLLAEFGLGDFAQVRIEGLSKGMAQKVQVLAAVAHDPEFVILDEPFSGLDPVNQSELETFIRGLAAQGKTILFSTHTMQHAERLCDRIIVLAKGRKLFDGTLDAARHLLPRRARLAADADLGFLATLPGVARATPPSPGQPYWIADLTDGDAGRALLAACFERAVPLTHFDVAPPGLHDVFVSLVGQGERDMKQAFLIARQEFIKYVTRRGFLLSILMFPLWIMIVVFVPKWTGGGEKQEPVPHHYFTVIDRTGGAARAAMLAPMTWDGRQVFATAHGDYVNPPDWLANADAVHFAAARQRAYDSLYEEAYTDNPPFLDTIVVIPPGFGTKGRTAEIWARYPLDAPFRGFLESGLTRALRVAAVRKSAPGFADPAALDVTAQLATHEPKPPARSDSMASIVPVALAIILFVISVMNSSVLLQGVVEEKSTRMIEVLLSCATPRQITTGKLVGVIAVALATLVIWAFVLFALMALADRDTITLVFASLKAVASLNTLPLLLIFFLCGLLIYGSLFLAIGSMASSLADAQSLLGPSMLVLMLPNLMLSGVIRDPNGPLASALSWVPVYTPFFMMLRLSSHPPVWQIWGTTMLALVTTTLMIIWTGRVFAKHVLTTERPPTLGALMGRLLGKRG